MSSRSGGRQAAPRQVSDWRYEAACRFLPGDMFFPLGTSGAALEAVLAAKAVCAGCRVRAACLGFALGTRQEFGIWGGTDEEERRRAWREAKASGAPVG